MSRRFPFTGFLLRLSSRRAPLAFALLSLLFTGCAVDQAAEVAAYRRVLDADAPRELRRLTPGEPLTLDRALALTNADNERLGVQGEEYVQALIDKKRAFANFLPTLDAAPRYSVSDNLGGSERVAFEKGLDVTVGGAYNLFRGFGDVANLRRAGAAIAQRRGLLLDLKASVLLDAARAFYDVLRSERRVQVLRNSLAVQEERVRDVTAQNEAGTVRPLDVAQAEAQAASTRVLVVQAEGDVRNARAALAFVIGAEAVDGPLLDGFEPPAELGPLEAVHPRARAQREDFRAARALVVATRDAVDVAFAQYYPSVSLNLDYFVYRETVPAANIYTALIEANLPLFSAGRIRADVRDAWSEFRQAKLNESLVARQVDRDVEVTYQNVLTSRGRLRELETAVRTAQEAFEAAADLVRFGRATNLERLIAQDQLLNAQLALANEEFNQKVAYLELQRAAGDLDLRIGQSGAVAADRPTIGARERVP